VTAFFSAGDFTFRPIVDDDVPMLAAWLRDPAVGAWWEGTTVTYDDAYIHAHVLEDCDVVTHAIVELGGEPIGFQQWYPIDHDADLLAEYELTADDRAWGIDQFVGESRLHDGGIGTRQVRAVVEWLLGPAGPGARLVVTDPVVENLRAVRCYEKAGFRRVRVLPAHEQIDGVPRDSWLMEQHPDDERPGAEETARE
jgi:aminoglycoside 6'-N-acetyltransferase